MRYSAAVAGKYKRAKLLSAIVTAIVVFALAFVYAPVTMGGMPEHHPDGTIFWPVQGVLDTGSSFYQAHITASDIDADGVDEILVGNTNGWLYCLNPYAQMEWAHYCGAQIQGAPACFDVDNDGKQEVWVGDFAGRMWGFDCRGNVLSKWGWPLQTEFTAGNAGIFSSPAIGDINGDGISDIVVGTWGRFIYAWSYTGALLPGWPYDNKDSVWSSPALADLDKDGIKEVIIGADVTGGPDWPYPRGGLVYALNGDLTHVPGFPKSTPEVMWSSPAVADIDGDDWYEIVIGTGHYWKAVGDLTTEGHRVYAFNHDGTNVPGWPVVTDGSTFSSPALGDVDGDGSLEIAIGCNAAKQIGDERIMVIKANGDFLWNIKPYGGPMMASPALGDIDSDGKADVIIGSGGQMCAWNYQGEVLWNQTMNSYLVTSPAVGDFDKDGFVEVAFGSGDRPEGFPGGKFYVFEVGRKVDRDGVGRGTSIPWPAFRYNSQHHATILTGDEPPPPPPPPPESNFHEYILLMNPGDENASVNIEFMNESAQKKNVPWVLEPQSRSTVWVNRYMHGCGVSAKVTSDEPIIAERSMYFNFSERWKGGHDSLGALSPEKEWYLAEGCTSENFDEYVLVQNPGSSTANVNMVFMREGAGPVSASYSVAPKSRFTLNVKNVPGCENTPVSTKVSSSEGVICERSMYFNYEGNIGGHNSIGVTDPADHWYLAEGYTAESYDTFVLVQNPGRVAAGVDLSFLRSDGFQSRVSFALPGMSRKTVKIDSIPGFESAEVSTEVTSNVGVIAERAMYFNSAGRDGGHDSIGVTAPAERWYLAEGYTGGTFDTYALIMNPGSSAVSVKTTFMRSDGYTASRTDRLLPRSRFTIHVDGIPGFADADVSTLIEAQGGGKVISERAMYFVYNNKYPGGHDSVGVNAPSETWYFAEGYTGD